MGPFEKPPVGKQRNQVLGTAHLTPPEKLLAAWDVCADTLLHCLPAPGGERCLVQIGTLSASFALYLPYWDIGSGSPSHWQHSLVSPLSFQGG